MASSAPAVWPSLLLISFAIVMVVSVTNVSSQAIVLSMIDVRLYAFALPLMTAVARLRPTRGTKVVITIDQDKSHQTITKRVGLRKSMAQVILMVSSTMSA